VGSWSLDHAWPPPLKFILKNRKILLKKSHIHLQPPAAASLLLESAAKTTSAGSSCLRCSLYSLFFPPLPIASRCCQTPTETPVQPETLPSSRAVDSGVGERSRSGRRSPKQIKTKPGRGASDAGSISSAALGGTPSPVIPFPAAPAREKF